MVVENRPAEGCTKCGDRTHSSEVTDELLKFAQRQSKPVRKIIAPKSSTATYGIASTGWPRIT